MSDGRLLMPAVLTLIIAVPLVILLLTLRSASAAPSAMPTTTTLR